jgi:TfoX/Sxy family transcriptional regulator of competence genes
MAYDERLAQRVREELSGVKGVSERRMFGGLAFLVDGKMCVGVLNDELVVRVGRDRYERALSRTGARPMDFTGRAMTGMVYVSPNGVTRGAGLKAWVEQGLAGAREATPSRRKTRKTTNTKPADSKGQQQAENGRTAKGVRARG